MIPSPGAAAGGRWPDEIDSPAHPAPRAADAHRVFFALEPPAPTHTHLDVEINGHWPWETTQLALTQTRPPDEPPAPPPE